MMESNTLVETRIDAMDEPARTAVRAIQNHMHHSSQNTIAVYATGSHAFGSSTKHSDLDIYHIVSGDRWSAKNRGRIVAAVGGVMDVDVIVGIPDTIENTVRIYGIYEYWATQNGICIYENRDTDGWLRVHDAITRPICLPDCTGPWMNHARIRLEEGEKTIQNGSGLLYVMPDLLVSIDASIKAALTHDDIRFPHVRRTSDTSEFLKDKSILCGYDIGVIDRWRMSKTDHKRRYRSDDVLGACQMARDIFDAVEEYVA